MDAPHQEEQQLLRVALENAAAVERARNRVLQELAEAREALRASNDRTSGILASITDGFMVIDREWRFTYLNATAEEILGRIKEAPRQFLGQNIWDVFPDLRNTRIDRAYRRALVGTSSVQLEHFYPALASWFDIRIYPSDEGLSVFFRDITRQKNAESLLAFEKKVLQLAARAAPLRDVLEKLAREAEQQSMDGMMCSVQLVTDDGARLAHTAAPSMPDAWNRAVDGRAIGPAEGSCGTCAFERRTVTVVDIAKDARWTHWADLARTHSLAACTSNPIFSSRGELLGTIAMYYRSPWEPSERDMQVIGTAARLAGMVIERARTEEAVRESEQFARSIVQSSQDCIKTLTPEGVLTWISERGVSVLGLTDPTQAVGRSWIDFWDAADRDAAIEALRTAARGGTGKFVGAFAVDGALRWWNVVLSPIPGASGQPGALLAVSREITERVQNEQRLRESEEQLRALADSIPQLAWMAEPDGNIFWYNRKWYEYTGMTLEQLKGWGWQSVHDPAVLPSVLENWRRSLETGTPFEMEFPMRGRDGSYRAFLTRVNPVRDAGGRVARWFGTNTDVEQVKQVRETLREQTRVLELLNETGTKLASNLDLEPLLQAITDAATALSGAQVGAFFDKVTNETGESYVLNTLSGMPREPFEGLAEPRATALVGPTFSGEAVVRCDDVLTDPRYGRSAPFYGMPPGHLPVRSYLAVPVTARSGAILGGLLFGHSQVGVFTERTEQLIVAVAAQAAIAIDNAHLYQKAQRAAEERKELLESERAARSEAERANRMKDEFLATLSHELRTPLSSILGWSHILRNGRVAGTDFSKGLDVIERNARAQTQLIDDLLDMSRIASGKLSLDVQPVNPISLVEAACETVRPAAEAKEIRIERIVESASSIVSCDPNRLQQVVWNLLSNAIKFTPKNGKVKVVLARVDSHLEISVADSGIGIEPPFIEHVFERFRQADSSATRPFGGLGLGLSIVKHLVELHGGNVRATSGGANKGSTFTISLPFAVIRRPEESLGRHARGSTLPSPAFRRVDLDGLCVLIVDDQPDSRELIGRILADCHANVLVAECAKDALAIMETTVPDVLVSDIGMPGIDGYEFLRLVRSRDKLGGGNVPAIALTAFARSEDRTRALHAGFLVHVPKPIEPSELVATVASVAGRLTPAVR